MLNQLKIEQRKSHVQDLRRMVKDVVSGGKGRVTSVERLKDVEKTARNFLKKEHARNLSFEMLMNVLSRKDKTSGSFQSKMSEYFSPMVHNATHGESRAVVAKEKILVDDDALDALVKSWNDPKLLSLDDVRKDPNMDVEYLRKSHSQQHALEFEI